MQPDPEYLRKHYASLSDEALLELDRAEMVEVAQTIYDAEVGRRKLVLTQADPLEEEADNVETDDEEVELDGDAYDLDEKPEWLEEAAELYGYAVQSAAEVAPEAALDAREALEDAGIPCYLDLSELPPEKSLFPHGTHRWRLLVPNPLNLKAMGVLECEFFNAEFEEGWKAHLEPLSDKDLRAMTPQVAFAGLFDRIARVNRVYSEELARRRLK